MSVLTKDQVVEAAFELPENERLEVIERLMAPETWPPLSPEQEADLEEAIRDYRANPHDVQPWSEIKAELLAEI